MHRSNVDLRANSRAKVLHALLLEIRTLADSICVLCEGGMNTPTLIHKECM